MFKKIALICLSSFLVLASVSAEEKKTGGMRERVQNRFHMMQEDQKQFFHAYKAGHIKSLEEILGQVHKDAETHKWTVFKVFQVKLDKERHDKNGIQYAVAFFTDKGDVVRVRYDAKTLKMLKYNVMLEDSGSAPQEKK
jgi:pyruvate/2-oxoglutarate dehydrogenase complex dihydrolipoamide acyltransferase (E2) component